MYKCSKCGKTSEPNEPMNRLTTYRNNNGRTEIESEKPICSSCAGVQWPIETEIKVELAHHNDRPGLVNF